MEARDYLEIMKNGNEGLEGLRGVLREDGGIQEVRFILWESTGWHDKYDPYVVLSISDEHMREGHAQYTKIEEIIAEVIRRELAAQEQEVLKLHAEDAEAFYRREADHSS